jgi:hypothetical protein
MENELKLQRDPHVKVMNKLLPKFTFEHSRMYSMGETVVSCKVKVKRVRKYFYNYLLTPPYKIRAIYELDVIVSDVSFKKDITGRTRDPKSFIRDNKTSFNKGLRWFGVENIEKYISMIDSDPRSIRISKIEYNV